MSTEPGQLHYATSDLEYDEGSELRRRARRSAFEVAWLFRPDEGVLEIHAPGRRAIPPTRGGCGLGPP